MGKYAGLGLIIPAGPHIGRTNCASIWARSALQCRRNKSTSRSTKSGAASSSANSSKSIADLPRHNVDANGRIASPLPPLHGFGNPFPLPNVDAQVKDEASQSSFSPRAGLSGFVGVARPDTGPLPNEENDYLAAVAQGVIPDSPLAKQVFQNWRRFPDCIILTRVGKFYESYFTPAIQLASLLSLRLAHKRYVSGVYPFAGFPVPQLDKYLKVLVQDLGRSVVLVEEYPDRDANASGENISRRIGRIVTPGTLLDESWVRGDESRYLLALAMGHDCPISGGSESSTSAVQMCLAYTDVSTGEFFTKDISALALEDELTRIAPKEIVLDQRLSDSWTIGRQADASLPSETIRVLLESSGAHLSFATSTLVTGIGTSKQDLERQAISLLRQHLAFTLRDFSPDLATPDRQRESEHMHIDAATLHALEIRHALRADGPDALSPSPVGPNDAFAEGMHSVPLTSRGTLLSVLRRTVTPSGTRLLTRTLTSPSTNLSRINSRLDLVETLLKNSELRSELRELVKAQSDVMRIIQRLRARQGDGRDLAEVGQWIRGVENIAVTMTGKTIDLPSIDDSKTSALEKFTRLFRPLSHLAESIENAVDEKVLGNSGINSGGQVGNEDAYANGISADLSEGLADSKDTKLASVGLIETRMEQRERERDEKENIWWIKPKYSVAIQQRHDILNTLKCAKEQMQRTLRRKYDVTTLVLTKGLRYGYHAYVTKKAEGSVLGSSSKFVLAATAKGGKAFIHGPWSALGVQIDSAAEAISAAQRSAFEDLRVEVIRYGDDIKVNSDALSELDMSLGFAQAAQDLNLTRPKLDKSIDLEILNGRHPAVEAGLLASARMFTPNTVRLQPPASLLHVITGPNQGGKSTILRQSALIAILAQSGSFVPADEARIGVVDRVFSRIGSRDDLFRDRSTFMLEMVETAAILRQATRRSLVIMDEIGRGTTSQAGVSIAYATLDHLLKHNRCRTLFATHYHELGVMLGYDPVTERAQRDGVEFWCTDIEEDDTTFSYSYRLQRGLNHESHAIKAAKLANMPDEFLRVAEETLAKLQNADCVTKGTKCTGRST